MCCSVKAVENSGIKKKLFALFVSSRVFKLETLTTANEAAGIVVAEEKMEWHH